ncbi:MAG: glycosyltransferase [Candidatus Binatia bacterium]
MIVAAFMLSAAWLAYTYAGYPMVLYVWSRWTSRHATQTVLRASDGSPFRRRLAAGVAPDKEPMVSVIVAAHDEAATIGERVQNLLSQDYPDDRLEVLVGSDGSTDGTVAAVPQVARCRIRVLDLPRQGRAGVHNTCAAAARGEILVFTDAGTQFAVDCLRRLLTPFSDSAVGCASGYLVYTNAHEAGVAQSAGWYWRYELLLRRLESAGGSTVAVTGACMAMRKDLFRSLAPTDDIDDAAPVDTLLAGRRVVFVADAVAYDRLPDSSANELAARQRIVTKNLTAIVNRPQVLRLYRYPEAALKLISHRVMRYLSPLFLITLFLTSAFLPGRLLFDAAWAAQLLFYGGALVGLIADRVHRQIPVASLLFAFCVANVGFLLGVWNIVRGRGVTLYKPIR